MSTTQTKSKTRTTEYSDLITHAKQKNVIYYIDTQKQIHMRIKFIEKNIYYDQKIQKTWTRIFNKKMNIDNDTRAHASHTQVPVPDSGCLTASHVTHAR